MTEPVLRADHRITRYRIIYNIQYRCTRACRGARRLACPYLGWWFVPLPLTEDRRLGDCRDSVRDAYLFIFVFEFYHHHGPGYCTALI